MSDAVTVLGDLAARLDSLARFEAQAAAAPRVGEAIRAAMVPVLSAHVRTGRALDTAAIVVDAKSARGKAQYYLRFHAWWPFKNGAPPELIAQASAIYQEEAARILGGGK